MSREIVRKAIARCDKRYRILIDGWKWSGTRHCTKLMGHKGKCGKAEIDKL